MKFTSCYRNAFCNCGVAIRAGGDLLKIDFCDGNRAFDFTKCGDSILRAYKYKRNDKKYNVSFWNREHNNAYPEDIFR